MPRWRKENLKGLLYSIGTDLGSLGKIRANKVTTRMAKQETRVRVKD